MRYNHSACTVVYYFIPPVRTISIKRQQLHWGVGYGAHNEPTHVFPTCGKSRNPFEHDATHPAHNMRTVQDAISDSNMRFQIGQHDDAANALDDLWFDLEEDTMVFAVNEMQAMDVHDKLVPEKARQFAEWLDESGRIGTAYTNILNGMGPYPVDEVQRYANFLLSRDWNDFYNYWRSNDTGVAVEQGEGAMDVDI